MAYNEDTMRKYLSSKNFHRMPRLEQGDSVGTFLENLSAVHSPFPIQTLSTAIYGKSDSLLSQAELLEFVEILTSALSNSMFFEHSQTRKVAQEAMIVFNAALSAPNVTTDDRHVIARCIGEVAQAYANTFE